MEAPCKDCPDKGCGAYHDKCPKYQEYKSITNQQKEEKRIRDKIDSDYKSVVIERANKRRKNRTRLKQR